MKLYNSPISPNGKRVRICAAELGISLEQMLVDFPTGGNRTAEYLALNPMGKIPTVTDEDFVLWESAAVLWYLSTTRGTSFVSPDGRAQADLLKWMFFCACHIDPYFTILVVERFIKARRSLPPDELLTAYAERELARFVPIVEAQLEGRTYLQGDSLGLADITLGCTLELSALVRFDLGSYPRITAWLGRLQARPAWQAR